MRGRALFDEEHVLHADTSSMISVLRIFVIVSQIRQLSLMCQRSVHYVTDLF